MEEMGRYGGDGEIRRDCIPLNADRASYPANGAALGVVTIAPPPTLPCPIPGADGAHDAPVRSNGGLFAWAMGASKPPLLLLLLLLVLRARSFEVNSSHSAPLSARTRASWRWRERS